MSEHKTGAEPLSQKAPDLHASTVDAAHGDTPSIFKLDPGVGIWALIVFGILLLILRKFAWGPILSSLYEREKNIRDSMDKAKQAQNESKRIANEQNQVINEAKAEAAAIIQKAKTNAESIANKIKKEALEEKSRIVESGIKSVETARTVAMASLKKDTAQLAVLVAEKLILEKLDDEKTIRYVENVIDELTASR